MRRLALAGAIILIFAALAAIAALGPFGVAGPGADLYRRVQSLVDATLVAPLGRPVAGIAALLPGLAMALAIFLRRGPRAEDEAPAPRIRASLEVLWSKAVHACPPATPPSPPGSGGPP